MIENEKNMYFVERIEPLVEKLKRSKTAIEKIFALNSFEPVAAFNQSQHPLRAFLSSATPNEEACLKQLIAIGQAPLSEREWERETMEELLNHLVAIDDFYRELGGLVGYQCEVNRLLRKENIKIDGELLSPSFIDISKRTPEVEEAIHAGIMAMPAFCEMIPLGGAADRLHLIDESSGNELPAAKLEFTGKTLLEGLLRDLESREYLYFKKTGRVLATPIALMTSKEKNNWLHVENILEENRWFGRPKESFRLFVQPLVPVVNAQGQWYWTAPWKPLLKPGGHGVIWKLAKDNGIFDWLKSLGVQYALIRQINNPIAGIDYGLLAFTGMGASKKMSFGFASCPRQWLAAEGLNILIERKIAERYSYVLSNIEYCDFAKYGIEDKKFTSNTNILFAHLPALEEAIKKCPFPGLLMNLKQDSSGRFLGRLESTMQNIADVFVEEREDPLGNNSLTHTFITYNERHKTISTTKKAFIAGCNLNETPEKCFYDLMIAQRELLSDFCHMLLPPSQTLEQMLATHPSFVFLYHPGLGPLFSLIGEKIRGGRLEEGSELSLEIADVGIEHLELDGSLCVFARYPLGNKRFPSQLARCELRQCKVLNRGVDWEHSQPFWKGRYCRWESLLISLEGRSEFVAEGVSFKGNLHFDVRDGERLRVTQKEDSLSVTREPLLQ